MELIDSFNYRQIDQIQTDQVQTDQIQTDQIQIQTDQGLKKETIY